MTLGQHGDTDGDVAYIQVLAQQGQQFAGFHPGLRHGIGYLKLEHQAWFVGRYTRPL